MLAETWNDWHVRIIKAHPCATTFDKFHRLESGAFVRVVDIFLIGNSRYEDVCAAKTTPSASIKLKRQPIRSLTTDQGKCTGPIKIIAG